MANWKRIKELRRINEPKKKVIFAIYDRLAQNNISLNDIATNSQMSQEHLEDIMLGAVEPNSKELILMANAIEYNVQFNLIPA